MRCENDNLVLPERENSLGCAAAVGARSGAEPLIWVRSALFALLALWWIAVLSLLYLPLLAMPRRAMQGALLLWSLGILALLRVCCGVRYRVVGRQHFPQGPAIIAAKHQSAWDTLIFHVLLDDPVYVVKRELLTVPLLGWYFRRAGNIPIARVEGFRALKELLPAVEHALSQGSQIIIFPEGTRVSAGQRRPYKPGIAALYAHACVSVVPVALNSGLFWGRRHFLKRPGLITLEVLPAVPPGLERRIFLGELERRIESATARLVAEANQTRAANIRASRRGAAEEFDRAGGPEMSARSDLD